MGNFKMVCIDIDGTLVNSDHQVTPFTKEVIHHVVTNHQVLVVLVSARPPESINQIITEELYLNMPYIAYNGAVVMRGTCIFEQAIPLDIAIEIYHALNKTDVNLSFYHHSKWYINRLDHHVKLEREITNLKPDEVDFDYLIGTWGNPLGPHKLLAMGVPDEIKHLEDELVSKYKNVLTIYRSKPTYLEIVDKRCTKTTAIHFLMKHLGINQSEVVAIGDNYNDVDMLNFAGYGVAMGNAPDEVKEIADYITDSNDENGVANALINIFEIKMVHKGE